MTTDNMNRYLARVKWFDRKKGFGIVTIVSLVGSSNEGENVVEKGTDVFVHHSSLVTSDDVYRYLMEDEYVETSLTSRGKKEDESTNNYQCFKVSSPDSESKLLCELKRRVKQPRRNTRRGPRRDTREGPSERRR